MLAYYGCIPDTSGMQRTETTRENGLQWMSLMQYGAEKAFQAMTQNGLNSRKLNLTKLNIETGLLGAEILVEPVPGIDEPFEPFEGILEVYNPRRTILATRTKAGIIITKFCHIGLDGNDSIRQVRRIELFTDQPYTY